MGHTGKLNSKKWGIARRLAIQRDKFRCKLCGKAGRLEVDHIIPLWQDPKQDPYKLENLQTLCRKCHIIKTNRERETKTTLIRNLYAKHINNILSK